MKDLMGLNGIGYVRFPKFKGHVKVTLHNCRNGKNEVIEGENIVTNAVRDILANNYLGAVDYSKIYGSDGIWRKWFGGVLLYEQAHPTTEQGGVQVLDPDDYFPRSDADNHLFAHAGQTNIDSEHDDDLTRGNPVTAAFVQTEDTIKQVWEWGPSRGNVPDGRYIRALSLTHADTGDAGLGLNTYAFQNFTPVELINATLEDAPMADAINCMFDDNHGLAFYIGEDGDWYDGHKAFQTNKITVYVRKLPFLKAGLYETFNANTAQQIKKTISTSVTFYGIPYYYFDQANKRLWLFSNLTGVITSSSNPPYSKTNISYTVLDLSDLDNPSEYAHGTIVSDSATIAPLGWSDNGFNFNRGRSIFAGVPFDGTYFYFPTSNTTVDANLGTYGFTGYQKINFSQQQDQSHISFLSPIARLSTPMYGGGLVIASGVVANGLTGYSCQDFIGHSLVSGRVSSFYPTNNKVSSYGMSVFSQNSNVTERMIIASKMINSTLFNLPTPVQKTSSQSMTVEYTLQEVSGNE